MPSLAEIRRWLRGEQAEGLPDLATVTAKPLAYAATSAAESESEDDAAAAAKAARMKKMVESAKRARYVGKYKVATDGRDAMLMFGRFKGASVSEVASTSDGIGYLNWMRTKAEDFPSDLIDVINHVMKGKGK